MSQWPDATLPLGFLKKNEMLRNVKPEPPAVEGMIWDSFAYKVDSCQELLLVKYFFL